MSEQVSEVRMGVVVFLSGASVMALELGGSRIVAPFLGTSIVTWTSLIGVILAALSIGYTLGGAAADKNPSATPLSKILLLSSVLVAAIAPLHYPLLAMIGTSSLSLLWGTLIATCVLFVPASILLGMVTPYAIRLTIDDVEHSGRAAGRIYACSTVGSLFGTFSTGFILFNYLGSTTLVFVLAGTLWLASTIVTPRALPSLRVGVLFAIIVLYIAYAGFTEGLEKHGLTTLDTQYHRVMVAERKENGTNRKVRLLLTDPLGAQSTMYVDSPDELSSGYAKFFDLAFNFNPNTSNTLMLGGGAYSYPKHFAKVHPTRHMDVVELDPGMTAIARKHFALSDSPKRNIYHVDARRFLSQNNDSPNKKSYDAIFIDVFSSSPNIPFHVTTKEFAEELKSSLASGGVLISNTITGIEGDASKFLSAYIHTLRSVFPEVFIYPVAAERDRRDAQNVIIVAMAKRINPRDISPKLQTLINESIDFPKNENSFILTDNYAPVENLVLPIFASLQNIED
jgi:spermidine synthase